MLFLLSLSSANSKVACFCQLCCPISPFWNQSLFADIRIAMRNQYKPIPPPLLGSYSMSADIFYSKESDGWVEISHLFLLHENSTGDFIVVGITMCSSSWGSLSIHSGHRWWRVHLLQEFQMELVWGENICCILPLSFRFRITLPMNKIFQSSPSTSTIQNTFHHVFLPYPSRWGWGKWLLINKQLQMEDWIKFHDTNRRPLD